MLEKEKMGLTAGSGSGKQMNVDPANAGNGVQTFADTHGMERSQVQGEPIPAAIITTDE